MCLRVLAISLRTAVEVERLRIRINVRCHLLCVERCERTDIAVVLVRMVAPDARADLHPVRHLPVNVHPAEIAFVTGIVNDTRVVNVGQ